MQKEDLVQGQATDSTPLVWHVKVKLVYLVPPLAAPATGSAIGELPEGLAEKLLQSD